VVTCQAGDKAAILDFLAKVWGQPAEKHAGFGTGLAAERFVEVLARPEFWTTSLQKAFRD
jgi:UDP-N-acetylglucosamine 2-epimerase (hydrolysing)